MLYLWAARTLAGMLETREKRSTVPVRKLRGREREKRDRETGRRRHYSWENRLVETRTDPRHGISTEAGLSQKGQSVCNLRRMMHDEVGWMSEGVYITLL